MMTRKELLKRINSIAYARARSAYRDEKAKVAQDVRQAIAEGQDVDSFLRDLEIQELRASLLGNSALSGLKRTSRRAAGPGGASAAPPPPAKSSANRARPKR